MKSSMSNPAPRPSPNICVPDPPRRSIGTLARLATLLSAALLVPTGQAKPILIYYHAWYAAPPTSPAFGWHWTLNRFDPNRINALGERDLASWYQPLIGPYDSGDPAVLEYHTLLMRLAGADVVVVNWFGPEPVFDYADIDARLQKLIPFLQRAGLKLALCYEDRALQAGPVDPDAQPPPLHDRALRALQYAGNQYFAQDCYLRWQGKPVLLNFGPQTLRHPGDWEKLLQQIHPTPALFTINVPARGAVGAFAWPPMWLSQAPGTGGVLSAAALHRYLTDFENSARTWPAAISCAFPRFHDIHPKAGVREYWGYLGDRGGATLRETLERALTNRTSMTLIATWNNFNEGTAIEPTREFGFRDLGLLQQLRRQHLQPGFPPTTNELALVLQLYQLRRAAKTHTIPAAALDSVAAALTAFRFDEARQQLRQLSHRTADRPGPPKAPSPAPIQP
jgi:hypothetical protein